MYHDAYEGAAAAAQPKRILILGESHHDTDLSTQEVVDDYLKEAPIPFFHKIALACGVAAETREREKELLWDKVFFGNYVDESLDGPHGTEDETAEKLIGRNKGRYNQGLAEFIKAHAIDVVFCFSFRAFDALPVEAQTPLCEDVYKIVNGRKLNLWCARAYEADSLFGRNVEVYGIPHPNSWRGFGTEDIVGYLKPVFEHCCK